MHTTISQICPSYPFGFSPSSYPSSDSLFLIEAPSSLSLDFLLISLLKSNIDGERKTNFIGIKNSFSHYSTLAKKSGMIFNNLIKKGALKYFSSFELGSGWIQEDLPLTEERPFFWREEGGTKIPLDSEGFLQLNTLIEEEGCIIIDDIKTMMILSEDPGDFVGFIQNCIEKNKVLYVFVHSGFLDEKTEKFVAILKSMCDYNIRIKENEGGFSKDITGRMEINLITQGKLFEYRYIVSDNGFKLLNYVNF